MDTRMGPKHPWSHSGITTIWTVSQLESIRKSHREKSEVKDLRPISKISVNSVANIRIGAYTIFGKNYGLTEPEK